VAVSYRVVRFGADNLPSTRQKTWPRVLTLLVTYGLSVAGAVLIVNYVVESSENIPSEAFGEQRPQGNAPEWTLIVGIALLACWVVLCAVLARVERRPVRSLHG
jgi:hypothetical protein